MKKIFFCVLMLTIVLRVNASLDVYSSWSDVYPSGIPKNVIQSEERYKGTLSSVDFTYPSRLFGEETSILALIGR